MHPGSKFVLLFLCLALVQGLRAASFHFDASAGDDLSGNGTLERPWKSLARASATKLEPGDALLLKAGSVWKDEHLELSASGRPGLPIRVDRYGEGADPLIDFGNTGNEEGEAWGLRIRNCSHIEVSNLRITSGRHAESRLRSGVWVLAEDSDQVFEHIHLKNLRVYEVYGNSRRSGGINFHVRQRGSGKEAVFDDLLIADCEVADVADTGIQLMTDSLLDGSGWSHKFDAFRRVVIRGCRVHYVLRDGILVRASSGALLEYNVLHHVGYLQGDLSQMPYLPKIEYVAALWPYYSDRVLMRYNEAYATRKLVGDGQAWDFDLGVTNSVYEYNYSHDNEGGALLIMNDTRGNIFRYNVSQNDRGDLIDVQEDGTLIENNTFFRGRGVSPESYFSGNARRFGSKSILYRGNIFYNEAGSPYYCDAKSEYVGNLFYGTHPSSEPQDPRKSVADPGFVAPGGAFVGLATIQAYALRNEDAQVGTPWDSARIEELFASVIPEAASGKPAGYGALRRLGGQSKRPFLLADEGRSAMSGVWKDLAQPGAMARIAGAPEGLGGSRTFRLLRDPIGPDLSLGVQLLPGAGPWEGLLLFRYLDEANYSFVRLVSDGRFELGELRAGSPRTFASRRVGLPEKGASTLRLSVVGNVCTAALGEDALLEGVLASPAPAASLVGIAVGGTGASFAGLRLLSLR